MRLLTLFALSARPTNTPVSVMPCIVMSTLHASSTFPLLAPHVPSLRIVYAGECIQYNFHHTCPSRDPRSGPSFRAENIASWRGSATPQWRRMTHATRPWRATPNSATESSHGQGRRAPQTSHGILSKLRLDAARASSNNKQAPSGPARGQDAPRFARARWAPAPPLRGSRRPTRENGVRVGVGWTSGDRTGLRGLRRARGPRGCGHAWIQGCVSRRGVQEWPGNAGMGDSMMVFTLYKHVHQHKHNGSEAYAT
jgi:hypothetical protein